jgi:hypothetical protein
MERRDDLIDFTKSLIHEIIMNQPRTFNLLFAYEELIPGITKTPGKHTETQDAHTQAEASIVH